MNNTRAVSARQFQASIVVAATLLTSSINTVHGAETPQSGGDYRAPLSVEPVTLDPAQIIDIYSVSVAENLFDGLVKLDQKLNVVAAIARRWKISRDHRTYTFQLRKGVKFHNGREVTADDFVFSFHRLLDPRIKSPAASLFLNIEGAREFRAGEATTIAGISVPKPYSLKIKLEKPFAPFLSILAMTNARVLPAEAAGGDFGREVIGTGPFRFERWEPGKEIVLTANEDYFAGRPLVDKLRFRIYANDDWDQIYSDFQRGLLDHARIPKDNFDAIRSNTENDGAFKVVSRAGLNLVYIGMNLSVPPFDDPRVRQALNYAVDTAVIVKDVTKRGATPAVGMLPPGIAGYDPDLTGYPYNPNKALELLAEAGFPDGEGFPPIELWTASKAASVQAELNEYQRYFAAIGLDVEIKTAESWKAFVAAINNKQAGLFYAAWYADYPDADNFLFPLAFSGSATNRMGYNDPSVDLLLTQAQEEVDYLRRTEIYGQVEKLVLQSAPTINQHNNSNNYLFRSWVRGGDLSPLGIAYLPLRTLWIDQNQRRQMLSDSSAERDLATR